MEYNLSTPKMIWAQGNTDDSEDSGKNKVLLTAGEHACLHHVTTDCSSARRNVIKTNDCQTVQTDVTLFYVKQEMTQAHRGTQAIVTGSDGGNDWSSFRTGLLVFESWVSNPRTASVYYAARGHICKLRMYCTNQTVNKAVRHTTYCNSPMWGSRTIPQYPVTPFPVKWLETHGLN